MGVLNLSADSFWEPSRATAASFGIMVEKMVREGADMVDVGAVSTRPGAGKVDAQTEWRRLKPALDVLASENNIPFSLDTTSSETVRRAADVVGRTFTVNDISSGEADADMLSVVAELGTGYIAMHSRGTPGTMDALTDYPLGVTETVLEHFKVFGKRAEKYGVSDWMPDPGFGFAKTEDQNLELLDNLFRLKTLGRKIVVGLDDKRFVRSRLCGNSQGWEKAVRGGADILRVHDVGAARKWLDGCGNDFARRQEYS